MMGGKNAKCDLVMEYGFFETQESRTKFLEKRDFKEIKTLFNIWAFLFGPLAYIFSGMFLKGVMWILIILFAMWVEGAFEIYFANFQLLNDWIIFPMGIFIAYAIFISWTINYFKKNKLHMLLLFTLFVLLAHVGYFLQFGPLALYLTNFKFSGVFFIPEFNIILAFLYTVDHCKQTHSATKDS